eukprot:5107639-Amphidinium_carterae.1
MEIVSEPKIVPPPPPQRFPRTKRSKHRYHQNRQQNVHSLYFISHISLCGFAAGGRWYVGCGLILWVPGGLLRLQFAGRSPVYAQHGMAATSVPLSTMCAIDMLKAGV